MPKPCLSSRSINVFCAASLASSFGYVSRIFVFDFDALINTWTGLALDAAEVKGNLSVTDANGSRRPLPLSQKRSFKCRIGGSIALSEHDFVRNATILCSGYKHLRPEIELEIRISKDGQGSSAVIFAQGRPDKEVCSGAPGACIAGGMRGHNAQTKALESLVSFLMDTMKMSVGSVAIP